MRRIAMGGVLGLTVWLSSAFSAEAQVTVTPTGPLAVSVTDTTTIYSATVTTNYNFTFYLQVLNNGNSVYFNMWHIFQSGPTYLFQTPPLDTTSWGLSVGAVLDFKGSAMLTATRGAHSDWYVTVSNHTSMAPDAGARGDLALAIPPDRRTLGMIDTNLDMEKGA